MNANTIAISAKGVKKAFKEKEVLQGVDITVERGSIFALLGSNGAGKTTLIKLLATLLHPDCGEIIINGSDLQKAPEKIREVISLTGQFAATDEVLTGRKNLQLIGELNHLEKVNQRSEELLKIFDLAEAADKPVATYSGGMKRRLDIAMSIMSDPAIIFLDEPTTGLDPQNRAAMWKLIRSLSDKGTTIFLTTQYLEEAEVLADKIAILNDGIIVQEGTAEELKQILPQGIIEFTFQDQSELLLAKEIISDFQTTKNEKNLTLTVITDGTIQQLTKIFNRINEVNVAISSFTQKLPTLEDAFYLFIGEKGA